MITEARQEASSDYRSKLTDEIEANDARIEEIYAGAAARMTAEGVKPLTDDERETITGIEETNVNLQGDLERAEARADRRAKVEAAQSTAGSAAAGTGQQMRVRAEPRQYDAQNVRRSKAGFLRDLYAVQFPGRVMPLPGDTGDPSARMARHVSEFGRDGLDLPDNARGTPVPRQFFDSAAVRQTQTSDVAGMDRVGGLVPEQYPGLVGLNLYAGAPFVALCNRYDIPVMGMRLSIPRFTAGPAGANQQEENLVADSAVTALNIEIPVATSTTRSRVTRQLIERGNMAEEYILDMMGQALKTNMDASIINGSGTGGNPKGFINATRPANHNIDQNAGIKTAAKVWQTFGLGIDKVARARFMAPDAIVIHQRRATFIAFALDSQGRPLFQESAATGQNVLGIGRAAPMDAQMPEVVLRLASGQNVYVDNNIPLTQDTNQDSALVMHRADQHCWGQSMPFMLNFEQTAGTTLEIDLVGYEYYAFTSEVQNTGGSNVRGTLYSTSLTVDAT